MALSKLPTDPMKYSKGYPCLYGLTGGFGDNIPGKGFVLFIKNGSSWFIANRKSSAVTYFPKKPRFEYIIVLDKESFQSPSDLYILDSEFVTFLKQIELGNYYIEEGGGTEWFYASCPRSYLDLRLEFLKMKGIPVLDIITEDPYPIRDLTEDENKTLGMEEITIKHIWKPKGKDTEYKPEKIELYEKFCRVFLSNKIPRRIQTELWKIFSEITFQEIEIFYKGIVQWPTGTGKTIAILMMVILAKDYCEKRGSIYRGLFVSPKNDILDTISKDFIKLSEFGIKVFDGSNAKLSKITVPLNEHCLVIACHQALLNEKGMRSLPPMVHIHYDEVHRITGDLYFKLLNEMMKTWKTNFLTGTSATPFTSSPSQREKITELFGNPLNLLHMCGVDEAVKEGWIAKPRFIVNVLPPINDTDAHLQGMVKSLGKYILMKATGGKFICYIERSKTDTIKAATIARTLLPWAQIYTAIDGERTDGDFVRDPVDSTPRILFACQRFREGSDIRGLEMTAKLLGNTSASYILLQICGRAGRIDDTKEKEGWCLLVRPSEDGTTEQDVLDSILLDIIEFLGKSEKILTKKETEDLMRTYIGDVSLSGSVCSLEETIVRIQSAYIRKEYVKRTPKEKYNIIRLLNQELGLASKDDYKTRASEHSKYIDDPQSYFKDWWVSWYHFLGVDTSAFPQTKSDWIRVCKEQGLTSWTHYKQTKSPVLPANPGEMYEDYTNWDKEFDVEEDEHIY